MMNEINMIDEKIEQKNAGRDGGPFIDININTDDEDEDANTKPQNNNSKLAEKFLFNFNKKTTVGKPQVKQQSEANNLSGLSNSSSNCSSPPSSASSSTKSALSTMLQPSSSSKTLTLNEAADILLSNLNEINLNNYDDEDDFDDDEEEDELNSNINNPKMVGLYEIKSDLKYDDFKPKETSLFNSTLISSMQSISSHANNTNDLNTADCTILDENTSGLVDINLNDNDSTPTADIDLKQINNQQMLLDENNNSINTISNKINNKLAPIRANSIPQNNNINQRPSLKLIKNLSQPIASGFRSDSLVEGLLGDIYDRFNGTCKEVVESDVFTEMSSSRFSGCDSTADHDMETKCYSKYHKLAKSTLQSFSLTELRNLVNEMTTDSNQISVRLIKQLKQKDKLASKLNRSCDVLTALLQAKSLKRRVDTQMKFTLNPMPGEAGFVQWKDAMKALARLPGGVAKEFRKSIWLNLSKKYIEDINLDWNKVKRLAFNERTNPDDDELGIQIVKDLHRTGCSTFSGQENEQDRALLKRVLLAFARYNKSVGYCQGFNIIAALILEIVDKKAEDALMCMIYLIDHILPEGYFTNSMHTLAIDMAVFRELLKQKQPKLCQHLNALQYNSMATDAGNNRPSKFKSSLFSSNKTKKSSQSSTLPHSKTSTDSLSSNSNNPTTYEPPLTNVFTMQWFLTLFATCLPKNSLLRVWDCIFLEGSEILFRTSIAIWDKLSTSVQKANSADAFYSMMSILSIRLFDQNVIDENELINKIYSYGAFPLSGLEELREKFTFNITPFQSVYSDENSSKKDKEGLSHLKLAKSHKSSSMTSLNDENVDHQSKNGILISPNMSLKNLEKIENDNSNLQFRKIASNNDDGDDDKNNNYDYDDDEVEDLAKMISCFALLMPNNKPNNSITSGQSGHHYHSTRSADIMMTAAAAASAFSNNLTRKNLNQKQKRSPGDISMVTPGAFSFISQMYNPKPLSEHLTLDLNELKSQYKKLKERQRQAHIIIQAASAHHRQKMAAAAASNSSKTNASDTSLKNSFSKQINQTSPFMLEKPPVVNHLLIKPSDPNCNTLKESITVVEPAFIDNDNFNKMISSTNNNTKALLEKILGTSTDKNNNNISNNNNNITKKKVKKPYYSDDEEDDSDDIDDYEDNNETLSESYLNLNEKKASHSSAEDDKLNVQDLIDINLEEPATTKSSKNKNYSDLFLKADSSSSSSSSSASQSSSPGLYKKEMKIDRNNDDNGESKYKYNLNVNNFSGASSLLLQSDMQPMNSSNKNQSNQSSAKQKSDSVKCQHYHKNQLTTSSIIKNLVNEEKKHTLTGNPFPMRHINSAVAKNGARLGLYK